MNTTTLMTGAIVVTLMLAACAGKQTVPSTLAYDLPRPEQTRSKWVDPALGNDTVEERANTSPRSEQTQIEKETSIWIKDFKQKLFDYTDASLIWIAEACGKIEKDTCHVPADYVAFEETTPVWKRTNPEAPAPASGRSVSSGASGGCRA